MNSYVSGTPLRLTAGTFQNYAGAATDPSIITLRIRNPAHVITVLVYGVDPIVRDGVGQYHYDFLSTGATGLYSYRWEGSGTLTAVAEREIYISLSDMS